MSEDLQAHGYHVQDVSPAVNNSERNDSKGKYSKVMKVALIKKK